MNARTLCVMLPVLALVVAGSLSGCGRSDVAGATATETAEAFASALKAGKLEVAAKAFDYVTDARKQNENWDEIPRGQRDLIVKKLQKDKAGELSGLQQRLGANIKVSDAQGGAVKLTGDSGSVTLGMSSVDGKYYINQVW